MNKGIKNIFAILILFVLLINNAFLTVVSVAVDEVKKLIDESKINPVVEMELQKYVNYKISEEQSGVLVQYDVKTGIEYKEEQMYVPIKSTKTVLEMPKIDNQYPENAEIFMNSTKAINGDSDGKDLKYNYDKNTGLLEVFVENKENENDEKDEFVVVANFDKNCYSDKEVKRKLSVNISLEETLANEEETIIKASKVQENEVEKNISSLISINLITSDIYNGFINGNIQNGTKNTTDFIEDFSINFSSKQIADEISFDIDNKITNDKNEIVDTENVVYKGVKLNKENVLKIFGVDGSFKILNKEEQVLVEINKYTETNEDGTIDVSYENEQKGLKIVTTKPVNYGTIKIENRIVIKDTMLNKNAKKIQTESKINGSNNIQEKNEETQEILKEYKQDVYSFEDKKEVEIKQSETKIDINLDKTEWTNKIQNDVNFTAVLVSENFRYDLFKNPLIEIKLPDEVEKVVLGDISVLYDNNFKIKKSEVITKNNSKVIRIELDGAQTEYMINSIAKGINIVIPASIILKNDIKNIDKNIEISYTNQNAKIIDYVNDGANSKNISIKLLNEISNQNENSQTISLDKFDIVSNTGFITNSLATKENSDFNVIKDAVSVEVEAKVGDKKLLDGDKVNEKEVIKYQIKLKNNKDFDIKNISIKGIIPEGTNYATVNKGSYYSEAYDYVEDEEKREIEINNIEIPSNSEKNLYYEVVVKKLNNDISEMNIQSNVITNYNNQELNSWGMNNVVNKAEIKVELKSYIGRDVQNSFFYYITVSNMTDHKLENIKVKTNELQKEIILNSNNIKDIAKDIKFEDRVLSYTIPSIEAGEKDEINFEITAGNFDDKINQCDLKMCASAIINDNDVYRSAENLRTAYPCYVTVTASSNKEGEKLNLNDEIEYTFKVKNEGLVKTLVKIQDCLPDELRGINAEYETYKLDNLEDYQIIYDFDGEKNLKYTKEKNEYDLSYTVDGKTTMDIQVLIPSGQTFEVKVKATAGDVVYNTEIANFITVSGDYIHTTTSNILKNTVIPSEPLDDFDEDDENPDDDNPSDKQEDDENQDDLDTENNLYGISGFAWIDENKNGRKEESEQELSSLTVKLFNADTNKIEMDSKGNTQKISTNNEGFYRFKDVNKGRYLVLFEYDEKNYNLTSYKQEGVSERNNSDVINKEANIDGIVKKVAVSDIIEIKNADINYINIGLIKNGEFDLKISKYVSKVTVVNGEGTKDYNYSDQQLAKIEISKKQITNTNIKVEYKIVVSNENSIDGYVNEITDIKPEELEFNSSDNKGWTLVDGNILKNTELAGIKLKNGESKEVTVVLTKNLTNESLGVIKNNAKISSYTNVNTVEDKDINNNSSDAELIVSVKTGLSKGVVLTIIAVIVAIIIFSYCVINKQIIKLFGLIFVIIVCVGNVSKSSRTYIYGDASNSKYCFSVKYNKDEVDEHKYEGSDGNYYTCIDSGYPLCHYQGHYYTELGKKFANESVQEFNYNSTMTFSKNNNISIEKVSGGTLIGPYEVDITSSNNVYKNIKYSVKYIDKNGVEKNQVIDNGNNNNNSDIQIITSDKVTPLAYFIQVDTKHNVYLKVSENVLRVTNFKITFTENGVLTKLKTYSGQYNYYFCYCIVVDSDDPHGSCCHPADWGNKQSDENGILLARDYYSTELGKFMPSCQRMRILKNSTQTGTGEYKNIEGSVEWSEDVYTKGKVTIVKKDKITGDILQGARFNIINNKTNVVEKYSVKCNENIELSLGQYTIVETQSPDSEYYDLSLQGSSQVINIKKSDLSNVKKIIYYTNYKYGDLEIHKVDSKNGNDLPGVGFKIYFIDASGNKQYISYHSSVFNEKTKKYSIYNNFTTNEDKAHEFITDEEGKIKLENIPVEGCNVRNSESGRYYLQETSLPDNLKEYYKIDDVKPVTIYGKSDRKDDVYNRQLLKLADTVLNNWSPSDKAKFIYKKLIVNSNWDYDIFAEKLAVWPEFTYSSGFNDIIRFVNNNFSIVQIKDRMNKNKRVQYLINEVGNEITDDAKINFDEKLAVINEKYEGSSGVTYDITNTQVYIDISGFVWEDTIDNSKESKRNNLYDEGEKLIENIPVVIRDTRTNEIAKNGDGQEIRALTDKDGKYKFKKVEIDNLPYYSVEFEYNGLKYQNVIARIKKENGSKAVENRQDRKSFNNSFASIKGEKAKGDTTKGYSIDTDNNKTNDLTYKSEGHTSTLVQNTGYTVTSSNLIVDGNNTSGVSMKASTMFSGYELDASDGELEINNVNLGIYEREQPDMAISTDVNNITVGINGYEHSYKYNRRENVKQMDIFSEMVKWGMTDEQRQEADYPTTYTREIYKNDAYASGKTGEGALDEDKKLQVNIIYKLVVKNESSSLQMSANEIANYYDDKLEYANESWYMDGNNKVNVEWNNIGSVENGYQKQMTNSLKNVIIQPGQNITVYLKMRITNNTILSWADKEKLEDEKTYCRTEIAGYSTYKDNEHYAGIDRDSAPDNINPADVNTFEDDTDSAPIVNIVFKEPRTISGYVFEDDTPSELKTNQERKGDGKYDARTDGYVGNVKVELLKTTTGEPVAYVYPKVVSELNLKAEKAEVTTSKDGKGYYEFIGILPDEYVLKFTYGDGSVIYKKVNNEDKEIKVTTQDYKSTIITNEDIKNALENSNNSTWYRNASEYSVAVDDYTQRTKINTELKEITNAIKTAYEEKTKVELQTMMAKSPKMKIGVENTDLAETDNEELRAIENINFGIAERPRMSLNVTKEISYIKLTLANGQTLVEGDPRTAEINYVRYPQGGLLEIIADNEIIQGATLDVTYQIYIENKSEIDYNSEEYYYYGDILDNQKLVSLEIKSIVDHLDENLSSTYEFANDGENMWRRIEAKTLNNNGLISNKVNSSIKNNKNILINDLSIKLKPGEKTKTDSISSVRASKLLTNSKELLFNNYVEILKFGNSVGRFYGQTYTDEKIWKTDTPGNFDPNDANIPHETDDSKADRRATLSVHSSEGLDLNTYVILCILGIIILSAIAGVIVWIKKRKIK